MGAWEACRDHHRQEEEASHEETGLGLRRAYREMEEDRLLKI
jgi:hypothetical protein